MVNTRAQNGMIDQYGTIVMIEMIKEETTRELKNCIRRKPWPMPHVMDLIHDIGKYDYVTALDLSMAFYHFRIIRWSSSHDYIHGTLRSIPLSTTTNGLIDQSRLTPRPQIRPTYTYAPHCVVIERPIYLRLRLDRRKGGSGTSRSKR